MPLQPGSRIGVYEITASLGAGGMGEVYRARDTRLNREVALKVLPDLFASDQDRLARFTREAQTLAALNHPNIAHIHGLEEAGGIRALAMELVEGEDLASVIARGPMALADALPVATQIADALEAAHEQGIVHRDLKPANIKVKPDGTVKVLDFGLAKALSATSSSGVDAVYSPTLTARATQMGVVLGTAAYMSPEQARGKPVDRRADIWAFGAVLFEMLTGRRAFEGDDISSTIANVLRDEPDWSALPPDVPVSVARLLRRCLEKDPKRRLSAIGDARLELDDPVQAPPTAAVAHVAARRVSVPMWFWLALAGIVAGAAVAVWPRQGATVDANLARLSILPPPGQRMHPDSASVAISPDGTMVAFVVGSVTRTDSQLWVRSLTTMSARLLEDADGAGLPFWSPDSRRIGFFTMDKMKVVSASGGRAEAVCDVTGGRGGTWSPSNVIVFAPDASGPLYRVAATGGTPQPATTLDATRREFGHRFPSFLPDGRRFLYASLPAKEGRYDVFVGSLDDTSRKHIGSFEAMPVFAEPGWLLYGRQGVLAAVPFDVRALTVTGDPVLLEDEPSVILDSINSWTAGRSVSVSSSGSLAYFSAPSINTVATWHDATGVPVGTLNVPPGHYEAGVISPDGTRGVLVKSVSPSESSLWLVDLARGGGTLLSSGKGRNDAPVWSPDGTRVVWSSDRDGVQSLFVKNVNDSAPETRLFTSDVLFKNASAWTPDGRSIVMTQLDQGSSQNVWLLDASGTKPPVAIVRGPARDGGGPVSPDGRWLAYTADDTGRLEVYVQAFPTPGASRVRISEQGGVGAWWERDGRQLVFAGHDLGSLWRVELQAAGDRLHVGTPVRIAVLPQDVVSIDAMPDRRRFLVITPERTGTGSITLVQNWRGALAGR